MHWSICLIILLGQEKWSAYWPNLKGKKTYMEPLKLMYIALLDQVSIQDLLWKIKEVLSLCCYWRDRKIFSRLHLGKDKLSKDPGCLTRNPNHFWKVKYEAQGITSILHRTYSNMLFLLQKLSISNYFGHNSYVIFCISVPAKKKKKRFIKKRKHNWIKCI